MDNVRYWAFKVAAEQALRVDFDVDKLPDGIRQARLLAAFETELAVSGMMDTWLERHDGNWAPDTVDALREIGAVRSAEVVSRARSVFPRGAPPRDVEERGDFLAALLLPERFWGALTDEYNRVATDEDVDALLVAYVRKRAAQFRLDEMTSTPAPMPTPPSEPSPEGLEAIAAMERAMQRRRTKLS